jgi:Tol biopolymer transport system component
VTVALIAILIAAGATSYVMHRWGPTTTRAPNFQGLRFTKLTSSGKAEDVTISRDGTYLVYSERDRDGVGLWLYQVATGGRIQILQSEDVDFRGLTLSPDGNAVYFVRSRKEVGAYKDLYVMPLLGGHARLLAEDIDSPVSFSPDGRQFVYSQAIGPPYATRIRIANSDGSENRVLTTITGVNSNVETGPAWSPDGRTLAVSQMLRGDRSGFVLDVVSVADGRIREVYWHPAVIGRPLWLPDSRTILAELDDSTGVGQLWTISLRGGRERRVTNDLANWGIRIDATRDAQTVSAIQWSVVANLWSAPATNLSKIHQISNGEKPMVAAVAKPDGKILAVSGNDDLWVMNEDGTGLAPFSSLRDVSPPITCRDFIVAASYSSAGQSQQAGSDTVRTTKLNSGRVIVHRSYQSGPVDLMRVDKNGLNPTKLAGGFLYSPTCSPDGKFVYYVLMGTQQRILRVAIQGGNSEIVGDVPGQNIRGSMRVSPDGRFLAFPYDQAFPKAVSKLAVISTQGQLVRTFDAPGGIYREGRLCWSPDGKGLQYLLTKGDVTNLWEQPLTKTRARQITSFTSGRIFDFDWTADGKQLLLARGEVIGDVVLLSNLR